MPTVIIEGPRLALRRKRLLAAAITRLVAEAYAWPEENVILVLHENGVAQALPSAPPFCIREILVPTDLSEHSDLALKYAIPFAEHFGAAITLLHVIQPPVASPETGATYPSAALLDQLSQAEKEKLARVCEQQQLRFPLLRQALVQIGVPHEAINATAREQSIDLIILATHARTGLAHVLHGSIAEKVVREAPCPILVLRAERRDSTHN